MSKCPERDIFRLTAGALVKTAIYTRDIHEHFSDVLAAALGQIPI